jgi:hypothetical protein
MAKIGAGEDGQRGARRGEAARTKHASLGLACPCVGARCAVLFQVDRL